ncbi:hypothetical protein BDQ12DRAFT_679076 [Crucibulum laeve]|uniref:F-box domain-containing protein n=1 Tax=Crucibulum laeve TaxID=68775 RepID=A0A5C3M9S4_9AGAR|nr:hypothetical protein BDQ12DRAFT_679076 [Crucibulum laeve]
MRQLKLVDIPEELIVQILSYLGPSDLVTCELTSSTLRSIIKEAVVLRYSRALQVAGMEDNPNSNLSVTERLARLERRESAWFKNIPDFTTTIPVHHNPSGIYDLTSGVYLLGNTNRLALHYCKLPTSSEDDTSWKNIEVERNIIDMGLAAYEHDLIAVVTTSPVTASPPSHNIELEFREFSTGQWHSLAQKPRLLVTNSRWERPAIGIEIVGEYLVLIITHSNNPWRPDSQFFVYEWKTGTLKLKLSRPHHTYHGLIFLAESVFLLPNASDNTLEIWEIPLSPERAPSQPTCILGLPQLADNQALSAISCRCEPNPRGTAALQFSTRPFHTSPSDAIAIFNIRVHPRHFPLQPLPIHLSSMFTFFVHRRALLDVFASSPHNIFSSHDAPERIPWLSWGPPITRWLNADNVPTRWITTTAGQRCVLIADNAANHGFPVVILDFNPYNLRRTEKYLRRTPNPRLWCVIGPQRVEDSECFVDSIESSLPYTACASTQSFEYEGVLMDEERVLGLSTDMVDRIQSICVHYFG